MNNRSSMQRTVLFLIGVTAIFAVASIAALLFLSRRPSEPEVVEGIDALPAEEGTAPDVGQEGLPPSAIQYQVPVDNQLVTLYYVPEKEVRTLAERPLVNAPESSDAPTATPDIIQVDPALDPATQPTATPAPAAGDTQPVQSGSASQIVQIAYQVQPNDTLYSIASAQGTSVALMAEYGIDAGDIVAGNVIQLPVANSAFCPNARTYVVREGDTAYSIGRRFNTTHEILQSMNGLDANYTILIGQVLCVP